MLSDLVSIPIGKHACAVFLRYAKVAKTIRINDVFEQSDHTMRPRVWREGGCHSPSCRKHSDVGVLVAEAKSAFSSNHMIERNDSETLDSISYVMTESNG